MTAQPGTRRRGQAPGGQGSGGQSPGQSSRGQGARVHDHETRDHGHGLRSVARNVFGLGLVATAVEWTLLDWVPSMATAAPATAAGSATLATVSLTVAAVARRRGEVSDRLRDSVAELLKARTPITLRRARWRGVRLRMIELEYGPEIISDNNPELRSAVVSLVNHKLGATYAAQWDFRRSRVRFTRLQTTDLPAPEPDQLSAFESRANEVIRASLGTAAVVSGVDYDTDDGSVTGWHIDYPTMRRDISGKFRTSVVTEINLKVPDGPWKVFWDFEKNKVHVERATALPEMLYFPLDRDLEYARKHHLLCAVTADGDLAWNTHPDKGTPHALITGSTGAGKTVLMRAIVLAALRAGWRVLAIDPKETDWVGMEDWPGFEAVALVENQWIMVIDAVHAEMMRRLRVIRRAKRARRPMPIFEPIMLVLDEMIDFYSRLGRLWAEMKAADKDLKGVLHPAWDRLMEIGVKARAADIHLLFGSQRPDVDFIHGALREQMKFRGTLNSLDGSGAKMMWESHAHLAVNLPAIKGRALITDALGRPVEAQVMYVPDPGREAELSAQDLAFLEDARPADVDRTPLLVLPPLDDEDEDDDYDHEDYDGPAAQPATASTSSSSTAHEADDPDPEPDDIESLRQEAVALPAAQLEPGMRVLISHDESGEVVARLIGVEPDPEEDAVDLDYMVETTGDGGEQTVDSTDQILVLFD